jgi:hypothetical protein
MHLTTLSTYTDHQEKNADRQVEEIAHIEVSIWWQAEGRPKPFGHIRGQSWLAVQLLSKFYDEVWGITLKP